MAFKWTLGHSAFLAAGLICALGADLRADGLPGLPDLPGAPLAAPSLASPDASSAENLVAMQTQLKALLDEANSVGDNQNKLMAEVDRVLNATGVHLGGEVEVDSDNFLRLYQVGDAKRTWPTTGFFDFRITAKPRPELEATVVYRMEKVFGEFWGAGDASGVHWFNIKGTTPIGFEVGMFHYSDTPFTFWAQRDEQPFEPELLQRKRDQIEETLNIEGNSFPLQGAKLDGTLLLFNHLDAEIEAVGVRTAIAGNKNSSEPFAVTFPFDQYVVGGTFHLTGESAKWFRIGGSYFELMEVPDTNQSVVLYDQQRNNVVSGDAQLRFMDGKFKITAQSAVSNYDPAYGSPDADWTQGTASGLFLDLGTPANSLHINALSVDQGFINYAAQTRMTDDMRDPNFDLPTGNNLFNPNTGGFDLPTVANTLFNGANNVIFATNQGPSGGLVLVNHAQPAGLFLTHGFFAQSQPEGLATPDRTGAGLNYNGNYFHGLIQPTILGSYYAEPELAYYVPADAGKRTYTRGGGGLKLDFEHMHFPFSVAAGFVSEATQASHYICFNSTRLGVDAQYKTSKAWTWMLGFEHWDANGADYFDFGESTGPQWTYAKFLVDDYVAGFNLQVSKSTDCYVSYSFQDIDFPDVTNGTSTSTEFGAGVGNFQNQEFQARMRMRF